MSGSVIDDTNNEIVHNAEIEDPDPSLLKTRSSKRIRRNTVLSIFFAFGILGALAIFGLLYSRANAESAKQHAQALGSTETYSANAHPMAGGDGDGSGDGGGSYGKGSAGSGNAAGAKGKRFSGASGSEGDRSSPEPSESPDALAQERETEAVDAQRAAFDEENRQQEITRDAIASNGRVELASYQNEQNGESTPTPAPTSQPEPGATPIRKTSRRFKLVAGRDFIDGIIYPNVNAELHGIVGIYVRKAIKDSSGSLTLVPRGAYILGVPGSASLGASRIELTAPLLVMPYPSDQEIDLSSIAGDADGTAGLSAKVDDHHWKILEYSLIGGALSGIASAVSGPTVVVNGVTGQQTSLGTQALGGAGAGGLQAAAQLARVTQPPTLTDPHAKHVIIYLDKDLYLDPYCDGTTPNSPECIVDEQLKEEGSR